MKPTGAAAVWYFMVALYYCLQERRWRRKLRSRKYQWLVVEQRLWRYQASAQEALNRYLGKETE